jgi:hypothetical protein
MGKETDTQPGESTELSAGEISAGRVGSYWMRESGNGLNVGSLGISKPGVGQKGTETPLEENPDITQQD